MNVLYNIIVAPIETIIDWVFLFYSHYIGVLGAAGAIIAVSIAINFLSLPLYNMADSLQKKERSLQKKMEYRIKRIKKAFTGDERFMMLQTYYRQNEYSPLYALRNSISVLIQIPFFIAAYHYLSNIEILQGAKFYFINDLGKPDALFSIGHFTVNVLPILMTLINIISAVIYTKDFPAREKIQVYMLAAVFLILLYNSPSGLVFYWILNNVFSLAKNIIKKTKYPLQIMHVCISILLIVMQRYFWWRHAGIAAWKKTSLTIFAVVFALLPLVAMLAKNLKLKDKILQTKICINMMQMFSRHEKSDTSVFVLSCIGLWLLAGFVLPSSVIATSPIEFSFLGETDSPLVYISTAVCIFAGFFVLWPFVIYKMFGEKTQHVMSPLFFVLLVCAIANVYIFKYDYGNLNVIFTLENKSILDNASPFFSFLPLLFSLFILLVYIATKKIDKIKILNVALCSICIAELFFGIYRSQYIHTEYREYKNNISNLPKTTDDEIEPIFHLSRHKKNVVVLFLDRAAGSFFPLIVQQFPELTSIYSGFTYYPNTLSFGFSTITGSPALMGGYEYSLDKINERANTLLVNKHNEATLVMPLLFSDAGFNVTVTDMPLSNYRWSGDITIFKNYPQINIQNIIGVNTTKYYISTLTELDMLCSKEMKNFCILQMLFPLLRKTLYVETKSKRRSEYASLSFASNFSNLYFLPELTDFESDEPTFIFTINNSTHEATFLNAPIYDMPDKKKANSTGFYESNSDYEISHYHVNVAAIKKIGEWLEYLKENDVYDNTRIVIVSDHSGFFSTPSFSEFPNRTIPAPYNPLLLVKDFNADGELHTDNTFMTNADTLFIAKEDLPVSDINPFTKQQLVQDKENGVTVHATYGKEWSVNEMRNKTQFSLDKTDSYHVRDDIFNPSNWEKLR